MEPVAVVERFYTAVSAADADALGTIVDAYFSDDAAIEWPPSLPYGGRVEGKARLRKIFVGTARSDAKAGPAALEVVSLTAAGATVAAELSFDWYPPGGTTPVPSAALELWTFDLGQVRAIRAFYWDTAALVAAVSEED